MAKKTDKPVSNATETNPLDPSAGLGGDTEPGPVGAKKLFDILSAHALDGFEDRAINGSEDQRPKETPETDEAQETGDALPPDESELPFACTAMEEIAYRAVGCLGAFGQLTARQRTAELDRINDLIPEAWPNGWTRLPLVNPEG